MRDILAYEGAYKSLPFEAVQALYRKRKILEILARYKPRTLLEVGCGMDPIFTHYRDLDSCIVVEPGNEFARLAVGLAEGRIGTRVLHATLENAVEQLAHFSFDFILISSLLHEVEDAAQLLVLTAGLCQDATIVHVNVPNARSFHRLLAIEMGLISDEFELSATQRTMQQATTFDLRSLEKLALDARFEILEKGSYFVKPFTHSQMANLRASGFLTDRMLDGFFGLTEFFPENGSEIYVNLRLRRP